MRTEPELRARLWRNDALIDEAREKIQRAGKQVGLI
jgi:hypothetical protein